MNTTLQTHNLAIGYTAARRDPVLVAQGLNLSLRDGELVCLLGPNGAGKSTLMRTLAGMQSPLAGHTTLRDTDITTLTSQQRATRLSIVLTERPNLGLLNGYALVALGRHPYTDWTGRLDSYDEAVIRWAVDAVGATDIAENPVMQLSDGQRQKLMIARALAQESDLILLDEPTAYLDLPRRAEVMQLLRHLAASTGRAILLSTHDLDLALRSADRLWLMSGGQVQTGAPEDLVLSGAFEQAFSSAGIVFDRETGTFGVKRKRGRAAYVASGGIQATWTRRALQRAGFSLTADATEATIQIEISNGTSPVWHLHEGGNHTTHRTIADLLHGLQSAHLSEEKEHA